MSNRFPMLPPHADEFRPRWPGDIGGFTEQQMRAYAAQAVKDALDARDAPNDSARLEWMNGAIFMPKWNGVIDGGSRVNWTIAGDFRHTCARMVGDDFRSAIDAAMKSAT